MNVYPQLASGALAQMPLIRRRETRTAVNDLADGSSLKLADPAGGSTGWELSYSGLSDAELAALQLFFEQCEGSLNSFTFVDPAGNLLAWSEDFANAVWQPGPLLTVASGVTDPFGGKQAFHLANSGNAAQGLTQTLNSPGGYQYSLSAYVKAAQSTPVTLSIGGQSRTLAAGIGWSRIWMTAAGDPSASSVDVSIQLAPGAIDVFGPQVDAQPAPSAYMKSAGGGVYQNARFKNDVLTCISTGTNRNSVTVNILYADHL